MADNTIINAGIAGDTIRDLARQAGTVKTQVSQLDIGGASSNAEVLVTAGPQTSTNAMPVSWASDNIDYLKQILLVLTSIDFQLRILNSGLSAEDTTSLDDFINDPTILKRVS